MNPKYKSGDIVYRPVHDYFDVDLSTSYVESWRIEDVENIWIGLMVKRAGMVQILLCAI